MADNREYEEGTIYEAGVGIYFSDGEDHTNINVEDEVLAQINQNTEDIEALDTRMTTAEGNISALDGRLTTAEGDIDNLEGRMTTAEGDIDALEGRMNTAEGDITTLQGRITTAEGDIDSLEGRMTTAESDIDALEGRMTTAEGNITSQGTRLTTAEGNITTLQGDVSGLGTRMTTAEGDIDALEGRMTTAEGDIDAVELRVTAIENNPTTVDVGTTTTGAEGTQASVTNSGTTHNAVFNFTIPKGDTGATGATGPQGPTGPAGPGVAAGGTAGQVLSKVDGTDYNTEWINPPSSGSVEKYTISNFDSTAIPATDPFCWFVEGGNVNNASSSYTAYMPIVKERTSRSGYSMKDAYLFRKESGGHIYALYVGTDYYTLFIRPYYSTVWACVTPVPGPSFLFSMSGSAPTLTLIQYNKMSSVGRPALSYDPESFLTDNLYKVYRTKMVATVVCDASGVDSAKSIQVPIMLCPDGDFFVFHFISGTTVYRILCKRTSADTWTATATAL